MTTSATLPSTSGPMHGGFSPLADNTCPPSEPEPESPRPAKRCLFTPLTYTFKKRRKQSTPVRISASEPPAEAVALSLAQSEGKPSLPPSPESDLRCTICQLAFSNHEQLQHHIVNDHVQCKNEPEHGYESSSAPEAPSSRGDLPWIDDLQGKEWMSPKLHGLPFSAATSLFMALPPFAPAESIPARQPVRIFNPDAYCDLCNKEFCNKYFLKTHKANKHGIYTDPPPTSEPLNAVVSIPSFANTMKLPSIEPTAPKLDNQMPEPLNQFNDMFANNKLLPKTNMPNIPSLYESDPIDSSPQEFCNGQTDRGFGEEQQQESVQTASSKISNIQQTIKTELMFEQEATYFSSSNKISPGTAFREEETNRLRRLGVMNPEAFCEICCKEYCNKYFLRTHKMKKHGIFVPEEGRDIKLEAGGNLCLSHNIQTSPLNLIMTEQGNSTASERKTTSPSDISCGICNIKFQNASLAQLHNVSVHSKLSRSEQDMSQPNIEEGNKSNAEHHNLNEKPTSSSDAISEDLQKLQTMILQLNDLEGNKSQIACMVCSKEFENRYYLHAHMMTEHGLLTEENTSQVRNGDDEPEPNGAYTCEVCNKENSCSEELKKHTLEFHPSHQTVGEVKEEPFNTPDKVASRVNTSSNGPFPERRLNAASLTPSSSYCEICNKELCNKYFMKTHMQRMHGIEIENGAQIGGVICDICNKELCSKYFLRVHKHNTHGIVEYGSTLLQPRKSEADPPPLMAPESDPSLKPADLADLSHRYFTHFTEVCTICSRRFRSTKWLKAHLLTDHGQTGADKWAELEQQLQHSMNPSVKPSVKTSKSERSSPTLKIPNGTQDNTAKLGVQTVLSNIFGSTDETTPKNYHCSYCSFSTPVLPFLFIHERSHSLQQADRDNVALKCPICHQNFPQVELLQQHLFTQHPFSPIPWFYNGSSEQVEVSKPNSEGCEEDTKGEEATPYAESKQQGLSKCVKKVKRRFSRLELSPETGQSLKDVAKKSRLPATYALPQSGDQEVTSGYIMQAFLMDEPTVERKFVPSVVFLPVLQKQSTPITVTFNLTPA